MRRTMVVSVFAGCGKTWLANHQNKYGYSMRDSDSSTYEKTAGWEKEYINSFMKEAKSGKYDFIFVCQTESVIDEMDRQKIPYVIVEPDNIVWNEQESKERAKERQIIKQQWFGRFILRDNSHIKNFSKWLNHMKDIYDERTGLGFIVKHNPVSFFVLKQNQYLSDIMSSKTISTKTVSVLCVTMQTRSKTEKQTKAAQCCMAWNIGISLRMSSSG